MRHKKVGRKFGRERDQRRALLKSLVFNLVKNGKIKTTDAKAKELRPITEKLITIAKKEGLANYRLLISRVGEQTAKKLVKEIAPKYKERKGGYLRIIKMPARKSDGSKMAIIELI
jgi:large subunit ribosomal protein L17